MSTNWLALRCFLISSWRDSPNGIHVDELALVSELERRREFLHRSKRDVPFLI